MLITNCKIVCSSGLGLENGFIEIENGLIKSVGEMPLAPSSDDLLDLSGCAVYAGFIDAHCHVGIDVDHQLEGLTAAEAIDFSDPAFPLARAAGVTTLVVSPGSAFSRGGSVAAVKTDGTFLKRHVGEKFALGENPAGELPNAVGACVAFVHAHALADVARAAEVFENPAIVHGTDADLLPSEAKASVIVGPILNTPCKRELARHSPALAGILERQEREIAICSDHPELPADYLRTYAGVAIGAGLSREAALKAITLGAAKICGLDKLVGSIEAGKHADLVIFEKNADIFSPFSHPKYVIINGNIQ